MSANESRPGLGAASDTTTSVPPASDVGGEAATFGDGRLPMRFWARVTVTEAGCWEWIGHRGRNGYGRVRFAGRVQKSHRVAWAALVGELPPWSPRGLQLDHLCRNRACCRPDHLELVTNRENALRGERPARTHCPRGHRLAGDNLCAYALAHGWRECLTCKRERGAADSAAVRAAYTALGITRRAYRARFGYSRTVAEDIVARVQSGVRPEAILAGADTAIAATATDLEQLDLFGVAS